MENEKTTQEGETSSVYIIGAVIVVAMIIAGVLLWPKPKPVPTTTTPVVEEKAMISKLSCDKQWFNPMIGFSKYYLSAEGATLLTSKGIICTFTVTANADGKVLATEDVPGVLSPANERGGQKYQCTSKAIEIAKVAATMKTTVKDDQGATASCAAGAMNLQ